MDPFERPSSHDGCTFKPVNGGAIIWQPGWPEMADACCRPYNNERGKGDHRHISAEEKPYRFVDVPSLLADFMRDVEASQ
jgi:hypothetical protein